MKLAYKKKTEAHNCFNLQHNGVRFCNTKNIVVFLHNECRLMVTGVQLKFVCFFAKKVLRLE
jgi:hypothetical protein